MTVVRRSRIRPERAVLFAVLVLCGIGLVMVYSSSAVLGIALCNSSAHFFESQLAKLLVGLIVLLCFWRLDYHHLERRLTWGALLVVFVPLVILVIQHFATGEVCRWFTIAGFTIQPSEFARIVLIVFLASHMSREVPRTGLLRHHLIAAGVVLAMVALVANQPNLSMALLILILAVGILYVAGTSIRWLAIGIAVSGAAAFVGIRGYESDRIQKFWDLLMGGEAAYQLDQGMTAVGSGGVIGEGIGNGLMKYFYLPFAHTDFILGIVGEETGLLGITILFVIYAVLIATGIAAARRSPDRLGTLLATGLTLNLSMNVLLHAAVNLGLVPVTGVPLPFLSCGGSSLVANLLGMGILLSVARRSVLAPARDWSAIRGYRR